MTIKPTTRVLVVDDEPNIALAIDFLMQQQGFETAQAHDGKEALDKVRRFNPDLMILDVMMPHMNGYEVAQELRRDESYRNLKIVFLTAKGTSQDRMQGYTAGADVYLTKPFDNQELVNIVSEILMYEHS